MLKERVMGLLVFDHLETIEYLTMRGSFPDRQNHRLTQPSFDRILLQRPQPTVNLHRPFGRLRREFRCPVFGKMREQAEQMIARRVRHPLAPDLGQHLDRFTSQGECRIELGSALSKLLLEQWMSDDRFPK